MAALIKLRHKFLLTVCCSCIAVTALGQEAKTPQLQDDWLSAYSDYASNQFTLEMPLTGSNLKTLKSHWNRYGYLLLYVNARELNSQQVPILHIGFFTSYEKAKDFKQASEYLYQKQSIKAITASEHYSVIDALKQQNADSSYFVFPIDGTNQGLKNAQKAILERAKNLYRSKQFEAAAEHYQLLTALADDTTAAWAAELAGLSYEKLGQRDLAMAQYRELLEHYPDAQGKERVNQRLRSLETAASANPKALKKASNKEDSVLYSRGVIGQYYRSASRTINGGDSEDVLSLLTSNWDLRSSLRWQGHDLKLCTSGYWINDQLDNGQNEWIIKRFLAEYNHAETGWGASLGRQRDSDTGVFTSFDGLTVSYSPKGDLKLALSAGRPVYTSSVYDNLDYFFYSAQAEWNLNKHWQLGSYLIHQTVNNVTDREAVGFNGRYIDQKLTAWVSIDYDSAFSEINNLLFNTSYRVNDNIQASLTYGAQRSPFLTASNILIGQADLDLNTYLQSKQNKDNLLDNALARTSKNDYYSINLTTKIAKKARWLIDYYDSTLSEIPSSEFLLGLPETGTTSDSFSYKSVGTQLILQDLMHTNDSFSIGVRNSQGDTSTSKQLYLTERLRLGNTWTILPKLIYSQVSFSSNDNTQNQLRYSVELTYRPWRQVEFNVEAGNQSISTSGTNSEFQSSYIFIGYRWSF